MFDAFSSRHCYSAQCTAGESELYLLVQHGVVEGVLVGPHPTRSSQLCPAESAAVSLECHGLNVSSAYSKLLLTYRIDRIVPLLLALSCGQCFIYDLRRSLRSPWMSFGP